MAKTIEIYFYNSEINPIRRSAFINDTKQQRTQSIVGVLLAFMKSKLFSHVYESKDNERNQSIFFESLLVYSIYSSNP